MKTLGRWLEETKTLDKRLEKEIKTRSECRKRGKEKRGAIAASIAAQCDEARKLDHGPIL
jgi:hypothetical protein